MGRLLCCGEAGEKEKESALSIFSIIDILMGIPSGSLCGGERSRSRKSAYDLVKIKNRSCKRSHKRDGIGGCVFWENPKTDL